jgi:hypothetical protein
MSRLAWSFGGGPVMALRGHLAQLIIFGVGDSSADVRMEGGAAWAGGKHPFRVRRRRETTACSTLRPADPRGSEAAR